MNSNAVLWSGYKLMKLTVKLALLLKGRLEGLAALSHAVRGVVGPSRGALRESWGREPRQQQRQHHHPS